MRMTGVQGEVKDGCVRIGKTSVAVGSRQDAAAMVPNVLFYDNQLVSDVCVQCQ